VVISQFDNLLKPNVTEALAALEQLDKSPNQELRGRPSIKTVERIAEFIKTDPLYQALVAECFRLPNGLNTFESECRSKFLRIDKVISNNESLTAAPFAETNREALYEAAAYKLFSDSQTQSAPRARAPKVSKVDLTEPLPTADTPKAKPVKWDEQYEAAFEGLLALEDLEQKILGETDAFLECKFQSLSQYISFAEALKEVQQVVSPSSETLQLALSSIEDSQFGPGCMDDFISIRDLCEKMNNSNSMSYAQASNLLFKIGTLHSAGASCLTLKSLQKEGVLIDSSRKLLEEVKAIQDPVSNRICFGLSHESHITAAQAVQIDKAVQSLRGINQPPAIIEKTLLSAIKGDSSRISYAANLAELAVRGVNITKLLDRKGDIEGFVAKLAHGQFDIVKPTDSRYANILKNAVEMFISISKEENPKLKETLLDSLELLAKNKIYQTFEIIKLLSEYGQTAPAEDLEVNIKKLAKSISSLAHGGAPMHDLRDTVLIATQPDQLGEKSHQSVVEFFEKLEILQESGVKGLSQLLANGVYVLKERARGNLSQHYSGFLLEAETAVQFQKLGYHIISMSIPVRGKYGYDILARSPEGQLLGIEVKRSIETFFNKNSSDSNKVNLQENNQLARQLLAATIDKVVPVIALKIGPNHSWAVNMARELVKELERSLEIKPVFIDRQTGRVIPNL
jgi:hypothetical protein